MQLVEHLHCRRIYLLLERRLRIEGDQAEIVVCAERIAVILYIPLYLQVLARVDLAPSRTREAHPAAIEIWHACAVLVKHFLEPREHRPSGLRVLLPDELVDELHRNAVEL